MNTVEERLLFEKEILGNYLPKNAFRFFDIDTDNPYALMGVITRNKKVYTIRMELDNFPDEMPEVYVMKMLHTKDGYEMDKPSHPMHTLGSKNGWTRICHFNSADYSPKITVYQIYLKCKLWLDMYEVHCETGKSIAYYLSNNN